MAQNFKCSLFKIQTHQVNRFALGFDAFHVARHFRWFAKQHVHRHVHRFAWVAHVIARVFDDELLRSRHRANHGEWATFAFARFGKPRQ